MRPNLTVDSSIAFKNNSDRGARVFVYSVWLIMMLLAVLCLIHYGRNIPLTEDWYMVAPLTDNEPNLGSWLWSSNNGHRVPLPRLILLGLLKVTKDFRSGMVLNIFTLGAASLISILVAQSIRYGRTCYTDAFFPIVMLSLGNWADLFWGWQFTQILPTILGYFFFLVIIWKPTLSTPKAAAIAGICLMLLPLCGGNGLIFVPLLSIWTIYSSILQLREQKNHRIKQQWIPIFLIFSVFLTSCLVFLYFVNYQGSSDYPPSPGLKETFKTAAQFLAISFGPIAIKWWKLSIFAAFSFLYVPVISILILDALNSRNENRNRTLGFLIIFSILILYALVLAYSRTGWLSKINYYPLWYMIFPIPFSCAAFLVWEFYGQPKVRKIFQSGLCLALFLLLPLNMVQGFSSFGSWYAQGMSALEGDIQAGIQISEFTRRHRDFLIHLWNEEQLETHIRMLHNTKITPLSNIRIEEK